MFTSIDEKEGLVRINWETARERFVRTEPTLTKLIDKLSPDNSFAIYLAYFPYGMLKGDTQSSYLPLLNGEKIRLSDQHIDPKIKRELGYGSLSSPLGIILDKSLEYFIEFDDQVFPYQVDTPGTIFNKGILLNKKKGRNYSPNGILKATAGARTAFMLPSINSHNGINKLSKRTDKELTTPRKLSDHFELFKSINQAEQNEWKACLGYFSEKWITKILNDPAWIEVKNYILEGKENNDLFNTNSPYYDIFYSKAQKDRNIRTSSPYLTNTAIHLIKIALGEHPGYIPATNEDLLPLNLIQSYMSESFQLKKIPTLMVPHSLIYESDKHPVYYSMQFPTSPHFLTKKNEKVTANQEIDHLDSILRKFIDEMTKEGSLLSGTVFSDLSNNIEFNYFHNYPPKDSKLIQNSRILEEIDPRFIFCTENKKYEEFSFEGQFLRGCVQVSPLREK